MQAGCCASIVPNVTKSGVPIEQCNLQGCSPIPINTPKVNPQNCFSSTIAADSTLQQCYQDFISAAVMAMVSVVQLHQPQWDVQSVELTNELVATSWPTNLFLWLPLTIFSYHCVVSR